MSKKSKPFLKYWNANIKITISNSNDILNNTKCKSCSSLDKFLYLRNCVNNCSNGFYYDNTNNAFMR